MGRWRAIRRWGGRTFLGGLLLGAILAGIGWSWERTEEGVFLEAALDPPGQMVQTGDRALHVVISGQGSPGVLLISGLGDDSRVWNTIHNPASPRSARVVSYDRAGYGWSPPRPDPPRRLPVG